MSELGIEGVVKSYGRNEVLHGVSLEVPTGSLTAVLGASGSGKTTLLRVIAGFERADSGVVRVGSRVVDDGRSVVPAHRRGIGYVPQEGALFPHRTVEGNIGFGLPRSDRHGDLVAQLVDVMGLTGLAERYPHQLSGGQQQRVALARALAIRPAVVLLDEPFASLDPAMRVSIRADVVRAVAATNTTTVLVTHDQDEALSMADQVVVLREGDVVQRGAPTDIYTRPADAELAAFLGHGNVVDAVVDGRLATTVFGSLPLDATTPLGPGPARVLLRPEQLVVNGGTGRCRGTVVERTYFGRDALLVVRLDDASMPRLAVRVRGDDSGEIGDVVEVGVGGAVVAWQA
jgi:iron(III) transport system ATP-binding protein